MNVDAILSVLNTHGVDYVLIGGVNFLLNHAPILTFDVDIWIHDEEQNRVNLTAALVELKAEWGPDDLHWKPIGPDATWLTKQTVFSLSSPDVAIQFFREVNGLEGRYCECKSRAAYKATGTGIPYFSLSDQDMLNHTERISALNACGHQPPDRKEEEERKRDIAMQRDPAKRWRLIQEMITWAEANMKPEHRRNRPRQPHQK